MTGRADACARGSVLSGEGRMLHVLRIVRLLYRSRNTVPPPMVTEPEATQSAASAA